jgi:hypothetical protein
MKRRFNVTYEIVTEESASISDADERGFLKANGMAVELRPGVCGGPAGRIKDRCRMTLREALELVSGCFDTGSDGFTYYEADGRSIDYGIAEERRALHLPDNATAASVERIARLLTKENAR